MVSNGYLEIWSVSDPKTNSGAKQDPKLTWGGQNWSFCTLCSPTNLFYTKNVNSEMVTSKSYFLAWNRPAGSWAFGEKWKSITFLLLKICSFHKNHRWRWSLIRKAACVNNQWCRETLQFVIRWTQWRSPSPSNQLSIGRAFTIFYHRPLLPLAAPHWGSRKIHFYRETQKYRLKIRKNTKTEPFSIFSFPLLFPAAPHCLTEDGQK